jgi:succinate dehydrogenase / fumarate reductase flavoprotein subunit
MQGLADGYFIIPATMGNYLATVAPGLPAADHPAVRAALDTTRDRIGRLLAIGGKRSATSFHRELGLMLWEHCGMARNRAGLEKLIAAIPALREEFWSDLAVTGGAGELNQQLELAGRVADFFELGELLARDALAREESCGGHFREEYQEDGEAKRDDQRFAHAAVWEYAGEGTAPRRHQEPLVFENVVLATRSYK